MPDDPLTKKCSELRTVVAGFVSAFPNGGAVTANIAGMDPICRRLEEAWRTYLSSGDGAVVGKMHSRVRAQLKFLRDHLSASIDACGSNEQRRERYREGQEYVGRKIDEIAALVPRAARRVVQETVQETLDFGEAPGKDAAEEESAGKDAPAPPVVVADAAPSSQFMKRVSELKVACTNFAQSYPGDRTSVVTYVLDVATLLIPCVERLWQKYCSNGSRERIRGFYRAISVETKNIDAYVRMSRMISDYNHCEGQYGENLSYVERKAAAMLEAFPESCREVSEEAVNRVVMVEARRTRRRAAERPDGAGR